MCPWLGQVRKAPGKSRLLLLIVDTAMILLPGLLHREEEIFLPTKAAMLIQTLVAARPCHDIVFADFHSLPDVVIPGHNAPLVATTV